MNYKCRYILYNRGESKMAWKLLMQGEIILWLIFLRGLAKYVLIRVQ